MAMCALLLSFLFVASAGAQCTCGSNSAYSFCWTGATSTAWTTASNWDTTGAGCTYPGASGSTTEMVLILTSAAQTLPTLSTALASARFAVLNITNTNPSAAMTVTVSSAFPALGTLYIGPGSVLAVQTLVVDTLIGPMSDTISATIRPYNSNLPSSVNITTSWATGPYVNNAPLTLLHTNLYVDCPGRTCSGNAYLGVAANNVYFTPGSNVALAGWLVFKNGGLKMYIMAGSTVTAIGSPGGTQWVINTASCLYVDGALTLRHGINTDSFQTCIMITGTVKLDYNATASNGNSAQLLQSAYIYFAPTASVQRLASTALLVLRPNAGNATVSSGAAIDVSEIYCQNSNAPLAACIFQAGSTLTASSVNIWSNTRFELQGDTIMPATKATQLSIDSGIAKMRTHAFTTLFCSRCTLVGGTFTFDRAQISSSAYFNSTSVTIQGPSVTGENSIYAQLVLSGGSSYLLNGPLKMYSGNITDDGTGTFTSFGPGVVSFEQTTAGEAGIAVNNLTFGGSTVITTKQTLTTLNLIANSPVVLKDTTLLSPGSTSLTINAPSGLSLQNQAGVTLQGALTINGPFSMQAGGVVTLNVASASPSPLQLQGSTVALAGTARLNFTTYVPSAPSNFTVATFTAAHTGTWSAAVASPYAAWPATAYDSTAAYMIGVIPPPPPPTTTPPTPPPTTTGSPGSATTASPATTGSPATAGTTTTTGTASPTTSATTSGAATTSATSATPSSGSTSRGGGGGLAPGAIAGIAIGGVVLLAVAGALVYFLWWRPHQATRQHFYE